MGRSMMARDQYTRGYWPRERTPMDPNLEEGRYSEAQDIRRPPMVSIPLPLDEKLQLNMA